MLSKFKQKNFFEAFLLTVCAWFFVGYLVLATVIHIAFVWVYTTFFASSIRLEDVIGTLITLELVCAMLFSEAIVRRTVIPWLNERILG
jgi:hypothetical protein